MLHIVRRAQIGICLCTTGHTVSLKLPDKQQHLAPPLLVVDISLTCGRILRRGALALPMKKALWVLHYISVNLRIVVTIGKFRSTRIFRRDGLAFFLRFAFIFEYNINDTENLLKPSIRSRRQFPH